MKQTVTGTYVGTGAALEVALGWTPDHLRIVNITDGNESYEHFAGMTDGHAILSRNVVDNATTGAAGMSRITANGVTPFVGTNLKPKGFRVGSAISGNGKTYGYVATRN